MIKNYLVSYVFTDGKSYSGHGRFFNQREGTATDVPSIEDIISMENNLAESGGYSSVSIINFSRLADSEVLLEDSK